MYCLPCAKQNSATKTPKGKRVADVSHSAKKSKAKGSPKCKRPIAFDDSCIGKSQVPAGDQTCDTPSQKNQEPVRDSDNQGPNSKNAPDNEAIIDSKISAFMEKFKLLNCQQIEAKILKGDEFSQAIQNQIIAHAAGEVVRLQGTWQPDPKINHAVAKLMVATYKGGFAKDNFVSFLYILLDKPEKIAIYLS